MKKSMLSMCLVLFSYSFCSAQKSYVVDTVNVNDLMPQYNTGAWFRHTALPSLEGTGFIFEKFMNGQILVNDSTLSPETYLLNIDAYTNEVKYMEGDKEYTIYNTNKYKGVILKDSLRQRYLFKRIILPSNDKTLYLAEVLHQGKKIIFYKHIEKRLHRADLNERGIVTTGRNVTSFDEYSDYFVKKLHNPIEKIRLKRSDFFALAAEIKLPILGKYCTEHKIGKNLSEQEAAQLLSIIENL